MSESTTGSLRSEREHDYATDMEAHLQELSNTVSLSYLVNNFAVNARRQEITRFLVRHELFKLISTHKGSIVECGVLAGNGLMSWAQLSAILEPVSFFRRVIGFDTFDGFPSVDARDKAGKEALSPEVGGMRDASYQSLLRSIELFDQNRFLQQFPKVSLVKGDFMTTAEQYVEDNPHLLVSLLYLDFDLYQPTRKALEVFLPRMSKGSVLAFDEINNPMWPGETTALLESLDLREIEIRQFPYEPNIAYIVL